jgi:hypothetical protein
MLFFVHRQSQFLTLAVPGSLPARWAFKFINELKFNSLKETPTA